MKLKVLFIRLEYFNNFNNKFQYINLFMVRKLLKIICFWYWSITKRCCVSNLWNLFRGWWCISGVVRTSWKSEAHSTFCYWVNMNLMVLLRSSYFWVSAPRYTVKFTNSGFTKRWKWYSSLNRTSGKRWNVAEHKKKQFIRHRCICSWINEGQYPEAQTAPFSSL